MYNRFSVVIDWPLFSLCSISNVWLIVLLVCPVSSICLAQFEFWICSLYRALNVCPVCRTYGVDIRCILIGIINTGLH
jgi:hypothetical protein